MISCSICHNNIETICMDNYNSRIYTIYENNELWLNCGYTSEFDGETYCFKNRNDEIEHLCDPCIARMLLSGELFPMSYKLLERLAKK